MTDTVTILFQRQRRKVEIQILKPSSILYVVISVFTYKARYSSNSGDRVTAALYIQFHVLQDLLWTPVHIILACHVPTRCQFLAPT